MRADDARELRAIVEATNDPARLGRLLRAFYLAERCGRVSRPTLYLHLGMLIGAVERLTSGQGVGAPALDAAGGDRGHSSTALGALSPTNRPGGYRA